MADEPGPATTPDPIIRVTAAVKHYGSTTALSGVTLDLAPGEILGVVGHNGAGKSTLMRVLSGIEGIDSGSVEVAGVDRRGATGFPGVRMAYQETSLARELTVGANIYLSSSRWIPRWRWRRTAAARIASRLDEIFPGHGIGADDYVDDLSIAARQMVEIARATVTDHLRVLILDEPTESLTRESSERLYDYVRTVSAAGVAVVLISHRLDEVLSVTSRVAVLRDGRVVSTHAAADITEDGLFLAMGGEERRAASRAHAAVAAGVPASVRVPITTSDGLESELIAREGEVVGLAGIAGQGQEELLERLWRGGRGVTVDGRRAYVPGDRQRSGILPLWDVSENIAITALRTIARRGIRDRRRESSVVTRWVTDLAIRGGARAPIVGLSGGNQQKVIVARAFASDATTILLDDPFRGVDVHTKTDLYELIRSEAARGRTIVWYSSENSEMQHCDRAYVLRAGRLAGELAGAEIDDDRIIAMSFAATKEASA